MWIERHVNGSVQRTARRTNNSNWLGALVMPSFPAPPPYIFIPHNKVPSTTLALGRVRRVQEAKGGLLVKCYQMRAMCALGTGQQVLVNVQPPYCRRRTRQTPWATVNNTWGALPLPRRTDVGVHANDEANLSHENGSITCANKTNIEQQKLRDRRTGHRGSTEKSVRSN